MLKILLEALESYGRWLERRREAKGKQTEAQTAAIKSVLSAVAETRSYLHDLRGGVEADRREERGLSRRWAAAAVDVGSVDRRLSRIALVASQRWADPDLRGDPRFEEVAALLDLMQRQCEWLLEQG